MGTTFMFEFCGKTTYLTKENQVASDLILYHYRKGNFLIMINYILNTYVCVLCVSVGTGKFGGTFHDEF